MEEESWRRNHGGGITEEESGGPMIEEAVMNYPGGTRRHLRGTSEAPRGTQEAPHPGGTPEAPRRHPEAPQGIQEAGEGLEGKMCQIHRVFLSKVARGTISPRGVGDTHDLQRLRTKVRGGWGGGSGRQWHATGEIPRSGPLPTPPEPHQAKPVWGTSWLQIILLCLHKHRQNANSMHIETEQLHKTATQTYNPSTRPQTVKQYINERRKSGGEVREEESERRSQGGGIKREES